MTELIVNLSDAKEKRNLLETVRTLEGPHRVNICKHRPRRSDRQNRYYWPCFVQPFAEFLRAQGEFVTDDEAHILMKSKFLRRDVINPVTGEIVGETLKSSADLDRDEFNAYLEACAMWLATMFDIKVPTPDIYREREAA